MGVVAEPHSRSARADAMSRLTTIIDSYRARRDATAAKANEVHRQNRQDNFTNRDRLETARKLEKQIDFYTTRIDFLTGRIR